ncbi:MAG: hypothetical protein ACLVIY_10710 [Anaerobutyricum soehngenii]
MSGLFEEFIEFHGDRNFGDDAAICGGIAYFRGQPVTVIAQMKGKKYLRKYCSVTLGCRSQKAIVKHFVL